MIVTLPNLREGIQWWLNNGWPPDMHNNDYHALYAMRSTVATRAWWTATVDRLSAWRANRPMSKAEIKARGQNRLSLITRQHSQILQSSPSAEPSITNLQWQDVAPLFDLAFGIKGVKSPVFACKMCHFLFPKLFVVMDNTATGIFEYEFYWRGMQDEWSRFGQKAAAKNVLTQAIQSTQPIHPAYPYETKIMDLCHIGYNQR